MLAVERLGVEGVGGGSSSQVALRLDTGDVLRCFHRCRCCRWPPCGSLTHCTRLGMEPAPWYCRDADNPFAPQQGLLFPFLLTDPHGCVFMHLPRGVTAAQHQRLGVKAELAHGPASRGFSQRKGWREGTALLRLQGHGEAFSFLFSGNLEAFREGLRCATHRHSLASDRAGDERGVCHSSYRRELEAEFDCRSITWTAHAPRVPR